MNGEALAAAAESLLGTRFRLHGRDPATGLDCVGLLAAALSAIGRKAPLPKGYRLRSRSVPRLEEMARECGLSEAPEIIRPGDVLLVRPTPCQFHLMIAARDQRFIHAHAGLRRVVSTPGPIAWPIAGRWRL